MSEPLVILGRLCLAHYEAVKAYREDFDARAEQGKQFKAWPEHHAAMLNARNTIDAACKSILDDGGSSVFQCPSCGKPDCVRHGGRVACIRPMGVD